MIKDFRFFFNLKLKRRESTTETTLVQNVKLWHKRVLEALQLLATALYTARMSS